MNLLDHPQVLRVLFHPRREGMHTFLPPGVRPVAVEVEPGLTIGGRLYPAGPKAPAILYYHGNGEIAADYDPLAEHYLACGVSLWVVDYRGYGKSTGTPCYSHMFRDADAVIGDVSAIAAKAGKRFDRLAVMGRSLGSAAAI